MKIIVISGGGRGSSLDYLAVAKRCGAVATLAKPFAEQELGVAMAEAL